MYRVSALKASIERNRSNQYKAYVFAILALKKGWSADIIYHINSFLVPKSVCDKASAVALTCLSENLKRSVVSNPSYGLPESSRLASSRDELDEFQSFGAASITPTSVDLDYSHIDAVGVRA